MPRLASDAVVESDEEYTGLTTAALTGRVGAAFALFEVGRCVVRPRPFSIERRRVVAVAARRELPPLYVDAAAPTARTPPPSWSLDNVAGADHSRRRRVGEPIGDDNEDAAWRSAPGIGGGDTDMGLLLRQLRACETTD